MKKIGGIIFAVAMSIAFFGVQKVHAESLAENCGISFDTDWSEYYVTRNGQSFWSNFATPDAAIQELQQQQATGLCSQSSSRFALACDISSGDDENGGYFVVRQDGQDKDMFSKSFETSDDALEELRQLRSIGLCR